MNMNTNIQDWTRVALSVSAAGFVWRMALFPRGNEPRTRLRRSVIFVGAILMTFVTIYLLGGMLEFWPSPH